MKTEIIQALLDGKTVQYYHHCAENEWQDFNPSNIEKNFTKHASLFTDDDKFPYQWRIKPQPQSYRLAVITDDKRIKILAVNDIQDTENLRIKGWFFVKWLTDWTEYEV